MTSAHMQSFFTTVSGIRTHVHTMGQGPKKILLLHGWGGQASTFFDLVNTLQPSLPHSMFIMPDMPGCGQTDLPPTGGWNSQQYAQWLSRLIQDQNIPENSPLIGHSNGARTIVRYVQNHQHSAHPIILMGSPGIKWPLTRRQKITTHCSQILKPFKYITPRFIQRIIIAKLLRAHDSFDAKSMKPTFHKLITEPDICDDLKTIDNTTLLIWGAQDSYTPLKSGQLYKKNIPKSTLCILPVARHAPHRTHTRHVAKAILDFITA